MFFHAFCNHKLFITEVIKVTLGVTLCKKYDLRGKFLAKKLFNPLTEPIDSSIPKIIKKKQKK
jgi:hypothetical protein